MIVRGMGELENVDGCGMMIAEVYWKQVSEEWKEMLMAVDREEHGCLDRS